MDPKCSRILYDSIGSRDKELVIIPGLYHEILNSSRKDEILEKIAGWMDSRL